MIKSTILFAILASFALESAATYASDLKVRFNLTLKIGIDAFIEVPDTNTSASDAGWEQVNCTSRQEGLSSLVLWCPTEDYSYCVYYDDTGYPAGMQFAISVSNCSAVFDMAVQGFRNWTTTFKGVETTFYTISQYYVTADYLTTDAETRLANRNTSSTIQVSDLWLEGFNGELYNVSTDTSYVTGDSSPYTKQACVLWMGQHYFYNMSTTTECKADTLFPWFPLIKDDQLIGVGLVFFCDIVETRFETPGRSTVEYIIPYGPDCAYELADTSIMTMHTYFIEKPYSMFCV